MTHVQKPKLRIELQLIAKMIDSGSRVLDVGCGDGALLDYLNYEKNVDGRGIELSSDGVNACVSSGLSVIQGDADQDLDDYPNQAFDYAILGQTLQATREPHNVLMNLVRIGKRAVISFPNFGYWRVRASLMFIGKMPQTEALSYNWYDTPNIHFCTITDFIVLCDSLGIEIENGIALDRVGRTREIGHSGMFFANLRGEQAIFLLKKS